MKKYMYSIFGIGNPLIDISYFTSDKTILDLELEKGTMALVDARRQIEILKYLKKLKPKYAPGGSAPNTILSSSGLGIKSHISGRIGNDYFADKYIERVKSYKVDSGLVKQKGLTGSSIVLVTPDGERTMNTHLGACRDYCPLDIDVEKLAKSEFLYFTGYMWDTESQKSSIHEAITVAKENDVRVVFDIADPLVVTRNKMDFIELIDKQVDIIFANEEESKILTGSENIEDSINVLMSLTATGAVKLGGDGSIIFHKNKKHKIKPNNVLVKDTTGAGDMYAAGFLSSISKGYSPFLAASNASILAEEIIKIHGAQFEKLDIKVLKEKIFN